MSMTLISTVTVGAGGSASISFTSIPQTYTDLMMVVSCRSNIASALSIMNLYLNNNGSSIYSQRNLDADGSSTGSNSASGQSTMVFPQTGASATSNTFGSASIYIPNYTNATNKSVSIDSVMENNATASYLRLTAGLFASTTTVSQLDILFSGGTIVQYSTASLYGITKGSGGATVS